MQPLSAAAQATTTAAAQATNAAAHAQTTTGAPAASAASTNSSGVVLRWRASSRGLGGAETPPSHLSSASAVYERASGDMSSGSRAAAAAGPNAASRSNHLANEAWLANPLRDSGAAQSVARPSYSAVARIGDVESSGLAPASEVRVAAYQPPQGAAAGQAGGAEVQVGQAAELPSPQFQPPGFPPAQLPPAQLQQPSQLGQPSLQPMPSDPLTQPELPPVPPSGATAPGLELPSGSAGQPFNQGAEPNFSELAPPADRSQSFPPSGTNQSPSDRNQLRDSSQGEASAAEEAGEFDQLGRRRRTIDASVNCENFRDNLRNATLDKVNLNSAPRYGQGLGVDAEEAEKMRADFAATSKVRQWCDRQGHELVSGRMIDLRNESVVLEVDGGRREIPLRDLCDIDMAYIGQAWNLPVSCGSGFDVVPGRDFVPSAMQWKASGLCHKPLYFEEVQLERYGHEIGPLLQPVVSTVHFFGNIAVLPYKMGIHPPHECQHALGYYRPGDCAPYMLPPIPISLRGAAVQAGTVVGAAALIP